MKADLIIVRAAQLLTLACGQGPRRGAAMADVRLIEDGAVAIRGGRIAEVGQTAEVLARYSATRVIEAGDKVVMPGFVDPHTHLVWAGDRAGEFSQRVTGATYMEIMVAGGGIMSTVRATRDAPQDALLAQSRARLDTMLAHGTTAAEVKTGYGLELSAEVRQLEAIHQLDRTHPVDLVPTFLGAHAVPVEYRDRPDSYIDLLVDVMLPAVQKTHSALCAVQVAPSGESGHGIADRPLFCDVFCEDGAFDLAQSRRVLEAAKALGFQLKIHVDEFKPLGGTRLAVELGAVSADHLVCTPPEEIKLLALSDTIAVALPGTPFGLGHRDYTPARTIIDEGGALALATDLNPGTCWCESMQMVVALACRYMHMTPGEAIVAATLNGAWAVGLGLETGSLEAGKWADLIILDVPDYRHLGYRFGSNLVETVIKRGMVVHGAY